MPHIKVQMYPGRSKEQKEELAKALEQCLCNVLNSSSDGISISIEDIDQNDWHDKVVKEEILSNKENIFKMPKYSLEQ